MAAPKKRRKFSKEFKQDTVRMIVEHDHRLTDVARDLEIDPSTISRWIKQFNAHQEDAFPGNGKLLPADEEIRRLKQQLNRVTMERDILKKAISIFSGPEK